MTTTNKRCKRSCVEVMRHLLKLDAESQRLILGDNYKKQLTEMRRLVERYEQECVNDWLQRYWPLF